MKATHSISAVTYNTGEASLTWECLRTGERFDVTINLNEAQCRQLAKVVPPCVYHNAVNSPAKAEDPLTAAARHEEEHNHWLSDNDL